MNKQIFVAAALAAVAVLGLFIATPITTAFAMHNDQGHQDKASVGECKRFLDKEACQSPASKEAFKDFRKN